MKPRQEMWRKALADSTGQWAFVLSLSRRMIGMLQIVRDCTYAGIVNGNTAHATMRCLEHRGLVRFELKIGTPYGGKWELTPAGECVLQLLEFANLLDAKIPAHKRDAA
jgi:hypothetical protein